ncbi:MAG: hypothetical protein IT346_04820 [Epsilonproteobacteria bacterium]|nr:hypothetical protein [Campylobacterota bacterium]
MKKVFVFIALFSVSSACATLEYNWKKHTFYSTHSEGINQAHYNMCVNEVLGEALLSEDFALGSVGLYSVK